MEKDKSIVGLDVDESSFEEQPKEDHEKELNKPIDKETEEKQLDQTTEEIQSGDLKTQNNEQKDAKITADISFIIPANLIFKEMLDKEVMVVMESDQLNILGQVFRPIFCGKVRKVTNGYLTLEPAIIKMNNAPFFHFPTPLCFPLERITYFLPFDCNTRIPIP